MRLPKLLYILAGLLVFPTIALAVQITVPSATSYGQVLIGQTSGNYTPTATSSTQFFSVTTTGSSGAATYSGGVLNIPQYSGGGGATTTLLGDSNTFSGNNTFSNLITGSISGNAGTVTNGVYTNTFNGLFDTRFITDLAATTSVKSITTLPSLTLPYSQLSGAPTALSAFTNDTNFITLGSLSGTYPIIYNSGTGSISSGFGTSSTIGVANNAFLYTSALGVIKGVASSSLSLPNAALQNSSISVNGTTFNLGDSKTITAASSSLLTDFNTFTKLQTFTGGASSTGEISATSASSTNLIVSSAGGSGTRCAQFAADGTISATAGACGVAGAGIQNIGPTGQTQSGTTITTATSTGSFQGLTLGLTIVGTPNVLTFTPSITGTLSNTGLANSSVTVNGTVFNLGDNKTITAASSSILSDSNTFSGTLNSFSNTIKVASLAGLIGGNAGTLYAISTSSPLNTAITGNAGTATALAANGGNCAAGFFALGVDASGVAENCTYAFATTSPWTTGLVAVGTAGAGYTISSSTLFGYTPLNPTRAINTTYPLQGGGDLSADRTLTIAFGTTTSNTWANTQTFTNPLVDGTLSGLIGGNNGTTYAISTSSLNASITGSAASVAHALTFNNSGSGASSGQTFDGSSAATISYNTIGAQVAGTYDAVVTASTPIIRTANNLAFVGLATTSQPSSSNLLTSNGAAGVYGTATSSLGVTGPITFSGTIGSQVGGVGGNFSCTTAASGVAGCLSNTSFDTFNNKQAALTATWPQILTGATLSFGGLSTTTNLVSGHVPYVSGVNTFTDIATSTPTIGSVINYTGTLGNFVGGTSGTFGIANSAVTNAMLANKTIVVNGTTLTLGDAADTITAASSTLLTNSNLFSGNNMFIGSTTIGAGGVTTGLTVSGTATTTALVVTGLTSVPAYLNAQHQLISAGTGTSGNCVQWGANNTFADAGSACGTAGTIGVANGGTGLTAVADGALLYGGGGTANLVALATSTSGKVLQLDFTTGRPVWVATSTLGLSSLAAGNIATATPTGTINGVNKAFAVTNQPTLVLLNGAAQSPSNDYTYDGANINFTNAPLTGSNLSYVYNVATSLITGTGTSGHCVQWGASNSLTDAGSTCGTGGGGGNVATSTAETAGQLAYWTSTGATPATLGKVSTSTLSASSPLTGSLTQIGSGGSLGIQQSNSTQNGYLSSTDWLTFNNKVATGTTFLSGNLAYWGSNGTLFNQSTSTLSASSPLTGSFTQVGTGGSVGCQTASGSQAGCLSSGDWSTFNNKISWGSATSTSANQVVYTDALGKLTSTASSTETCTSPLSCTGHAVLSGGGAITITQSGTGANGYLSSTDFNTFNNKIGWGQATSTSANQFVYTDNNGKLISVASSSLSLPNGALQNSTISGVALGNTLAALTAGVTLTSAGTYTGNTARTFDIDLTHANTWSGSQMFIASTTIGAGGVTTGLTISGTATTTNFINTSVTSALALFDANHKETAYGGSSGVCTNQFPTSLSALGALGGCTSVADAFLTGQVGLAHGGSNASLSGANDVIFMNAANTALATDNNFNWNTAANWFGAGTSTPKWLATFATSTAPQLTLGDGLNDNLWSFRSVGGNLYLATSSPTTFATSTFSALSLTPSSLSQIVVGATSSIAAFPATTVAAFLNEPAGNGTNASTTMVLSDTSTTTSRSQIQMTTNTGTIVCLYVVGTTLTVGSGACN